MIIDCFPFFNELDLLELRLNELKDVVDVFVLSEATLTFTGKPKPLYFNENKERFKDFNIDHVIISTFNGIDRNPVRMDRGQKQRGIDYMINTYNPSGDDVVILSDLDEIPKAESVKKAVKDDWEAAMIEMQLYYYFMDCQCLGRAGSWRNPRVIRPMGKPIPKYNIVRKGRSDRDYWRAGWHFSFLDRIEYKIDSWTHAPEFNKPPYNTKQHIEDCINNGKDLFMRKRYQFKFVDDLSYLPKYVLENMDKYGKYIRGDNGQI